MTYSHHRLAIPTNSEYSIPQLRFMMKEIKDVIGKEIFADQWNNL